LSALKDTDGSHPQGTLRGTFPGVLIAGPNVEPKLLKKWEGSVWPKVASKIGGTLQKNIKESCF
jgi:hypothetical protein